MPVKARALHSPRLRSPSDTSAPSRARAGPRRPLREKTPPHLRRPSPGRCPGIPPPSPPPRHRPSHSRRRAPRGGLAPAAGRIPDVRPHTPPHSGKRGPPQAIRFFPASGPAAFPGPECSCRRARRPPDHPPFRWKPRAPKAPPPARPAGPRRGKTGGKSGKCGPAPRSRKPRTGGPGGGAARAGVWPPAPAPRLRAPRGKHTAGRGRGGLEGGRGEGGRGWEGGRSRRHPRPAGRAGRLCPRAPVWREAIRK